LEFAGLVQAKLKPTGSFVLDVGGAYQRGVPARSLYHLRIPIRFCDELGFFLAEDFFWHNPAKLPSPIEWVNKRKIRAKDSVDTVWWFSKTEWPKADVTKVLAPYSDRMRKLIEDPDSFYKPRVRPSGHDVSRAFARDNGGAIPSNLLQISNTESNGGYMAGCKLVGADRHPARFPAKLPEFFIRFLTDPGDLVLDIFAGSNTTGQVAEAEGRRWIGFEERLDYLAASIFRFLPKDISPDRLREAYGQVASGAGADLDTYVSQTVLDLRSVPT
jgi:site-specific DNA-methyltransferase (cytosine-N4-specific)